MKLIDDYTGAEMEALTPEEITKLIDLECAEAGVPFLPPQPVKPEIPLPEPEWKMYRVPGTDLYFHSEDDAASALQKLRALNPSAVKYEYAFGYQCRSVQWAEPISLNGDTEVTRVYKRETIDKHKNDAARIKQQMEDFDADAKAYERIATARQQIADSVWAKIGAAQRWKDKREELERVFARYWEMAEGDLAIALRFFQRANPEYLQYLEITPHDEGSTPGYLVVRQYCDSAPVEV